MLVESRADAATVAKRQRGDHKRLPSDDDHVAPPFYPKRKHGLVIDESWNGHFDVRSSFKVTVRYKEVLVQYLHC